jgi:hypothetical protein
MIDRDPTMLEWLLTLSEGNCLHRSLFRGQRFHVELPVRYRACGEACWHRGRTENISPAGLFFSADRLLAVDTQVEISFEILVGIDGATVGELVCQGEIVRMVLPATVDAQPGLAARILECDFVRCQKAASA